MNKNNNGNNSCCFRVKGVEVKAIFVHHLNEQNETRECKKEESRRLTGAKEIRFLSQLLFANESTMTV